MRIIRTIVALSSVSLAISASAQLKIVTTTQDLASIAASVGGNKVSVTSLVTGARDPHRLEARPSFMSKVASAKLFIAVGLELEIGYERPILDGSRNSAVAIGAKGHQYAAEWARILERPTRAVSRADGDLHPHGNPHIWLDPYNARMIAGGLANKLAQLDPTNAAAYRANAMVFQRRIDEGMFGESLVKRFGAAKLWNWSEHGGLQSELRKAGALGEAGGWSAKLLRFTGTPIITYHRSWSYFVDRFGLRVVEELEPKPGLDPTPSHLANVLRVGQQERVKVILQEPFYSTRDAEFVARRLGAKVIVTANSVGQDSGAKDYVALMNQLVDRVASVLAGAGSAEQAEVGLAPTW